MMSRLAFFYALVLCLSNFCQAADLPNIVVFISDDLGRLDTSVYGSDDARTPTMDLLAASGMVFNQAYVASPSCCPNRYSFLTGLMPARHGAHANHSQVVAGTKFLPPILKQLGYTILSFGKVAHGRASWDGCDFNSPVPKGMSSRVEKYFERENTNGPVCLLVGDRRPHVSWTKENTYDPNELTLPPYLIDTPQTRNHYARYLSDITGMDQELGRIWQIAKQEWGNDFVFVFTSDHGAQWPFGKWNLYDAGTRIPLIVSWPGRIEAGVRTDALVSWVDLLPTLIDLAGGKAPQEIDGSSFAGVLLGERSEHREEIFTTHSGDGNMNIYPIRSIRRGKWKFIHNLRHDGYHTNHSDRLRKDGAGAYWNSWDILAEKDTAAAAIIRKYYVRPEFELYDLQQDPLEQTNLLDFDLNAGPSDWTEQQSIYATTKDDLCERLVAWMRDQADLGEAHREPYPKNEPLPELK